MAAVNPVDIVAQAIRTQDGNHDKGAAELAEIAIEALRVPVMQVDRDDYESVRAWSVAETKAEGYNQALRDVFGDARLMRAVWDGTNVEDVMHISGCSEEDVRNHIPIGALVECDEHGGWNYYENEKEAQEGKKS